MKTINGTGSEMEFFETAFHKIYLNKEDYKSDCLHDNCQSCGGTGQKKDGSGPCFHMNSCTCKKCSV